MSIFETIIPAAESLYEDTCTIYHYTEAENENHSTSLVKEVLYSDVPCRLSYQSITNADQTETSDNKTQIIKLFVSKNIKVDAGSFIVIERDGRELRFKCSGESGVYRSHQEIVLTIEKEEA